MKRSLALPLVLGLLMSAVFLLPKAGEVAQSAISMELPKVLYPWQFYRLPPTDKEVEILAKDTDFSKAVCGKPLPGYDEDGNPNFRRIELSVVLSGSDINNSIHRPERCMPAQGHQIYDSRDDLITTQEGRTFPARVLTSVQKGMMKVKDQEQPFERRCVTYYFFVGQHQITQNHITRAFIDMWDRVAHGQDQRWAYVSATEVFTDKKEQDLPDREEAEKEIRQFLGDLADRNIDWHRIGAR